MAGQVEVVIDKAQLSRIIDKVDPVIVDDQLLLMLQELAGTAHRVAVGQAPVDQGALRKDMAVEATSLSARVYFQNPQTYHTVMEEGRKPGGKMPPPAALAGWAARHGMAGMEFVLARSIARRGTKGRFYMKAGAEAAQNALPSELRSMAARIQTQWER